MFFDIFSDLCKKKGISKTKAAEEIGLSNSITTKWKKTGATPSGETLDKVAAYFNVSTDYLLGKESNKVLDLFTGDVKKEYTEIEKLILEEISKKDPHVSIEETVRAIRLFNVIWTKPPAEKDALMTILGVPED